MDKIDTIYDLHEKLKPIFYEASQYFLPDEDITLNYTGGKIIIKFE